MIDRKNFKTMAEQTDQELATEVGNEMLQKLIQSIANPPDPNAWKVNEYHVSIYILHCLYSTMQ